MAATKNTERKMATDHNVADEEQGTTLLAMLVVGFVLIVVGMVAVMVFV